MILGIVGGMGPLATCELFRKTIEFTECGIRVKVKLLK